MRTLNEIADSSWIGTFPKKWNMLPIKSLFNFSKGLNITKEDLTDNVDFSHYFRWLFANFRECSLIS